jgi:hypothetical protein
MAAGCGEKAAPPAGPLFREVASETGMKFHHFTGATGEFYMPEIMGAGAALLDYDNDGDLDVYLIQGSMLDPRKNPDEARFPLPPGERLGNRLYRNEVAPSGALHFSDVTAQAGVGHIGYGMGAATGDYDNDGDTDLYVTNFGSNVLYRNNGNGAFTDVTREAGVDDERWSTSAAFVDYDRDGDLDLFLLNYIDFTVKGNKRCFAATGEPDYCTPKAYRPVTARLFRNEGGGRFRDVSTAAGVTAAYGPGLGVTCSDLDGDGWIDIYVANDTAANLLWLNRKDGTFREAGLELGAAYSEDGLARAGMGVSAGDFDGDGDDDLVVVNLTREGATLYRNEGVSGFQDATAALGLRTMTFPYTGFGLEWFDYDNDGRLDLFVANGAVALMESLRGEAYPFHQRNQLIRNDGTRFVDVTAAGGAALELSEVSRGAAFGDIDNDGDIDIVVTNNNGPARLLRNEAARGRNWLLVKLEGLKSNRQGIGARVGVWREGQKPLWRRAHTDSSYLSASDPRVHFGLGQSRGPVTVEVRWPDGSIERWSGVGLNRLATLREGSGAR